MKWRDALHIDLGQLLLGRIVVQPASSLARSESLIREALRVPPSLFMRGLTANASSRHMHLIRVTELLARIVACHAPLVPALDAALADRTHPRVWRMLASLRTGLAEGRSLAESMRASPKYFPKYYVDAIEAGECTGSLGGALRELASGMDEGWRLRDSFWTGATYFSAVILITSAISVFLFMKVFPVFGEIMQDFSGSKAQYPAVVSLYDFFNVTLFRVTLFDAHIRVPLLPIVAAALLITIWRVWRSRGRIGMLIPGARRCVIEANLAHLARILARLLHGGCPLDEALATAETAQLQPPLRKALCAVHERVRAGKSFAGALAAEPIIPASFRTMAGLGESGGQLPEMLDGLAEQYETRTLRVSQMALSALFVVCILAVASVLFTVYSFPFHAYVAIVDDIIAQM